MKFIAFLNAYSQGLSGGDACFLNVARELGRKHDLLIVTSRMGMSLCRREGIMSKFVVTTREASFKNIFFTYLHRIVLALIRVRPENGVVIFTSSDSPPDVGPSFLFRLLYTKSFWVQKIFHIIPRGQGLRRFVQMTSFFFIKLLSDLVIVDSQMLREELATYYGFDARKVRAITPGFDFDYILSIKPLEKKFDGIFVGQLRKSKGVLDLIPIWKRVVAQIPDASLAIVGKDLQNNRQKIRQAVFNSGLEKNVTINGFIGKGVIYGMMKSAGVLVLPSYEEGFGMVIVEALVCKLRPITYRLPILNELFKGKITMVPNGNIDKFSEEVVKILLRGQRLREVSIDGLIDKFDLNKSTKNEIFLIENAVEKATR